jgi:hypothetical protein
MKHLAAAWRSMLLFSQRRRSMAGIGIVVVVVVLVVVVIISTRKD